MKTIAGRGRSKLFSVKTTRKFDGFSDAGKVHKCLEIMLTKPGTATPNNGQLKVKNERECYVSVNWPHLCVTNLLTFH